MPLKYLSRLLCRSRADPGAEPAMSPSAEEVALAMDAWQAGWDGWVHTEPPAALKMQAAQAAKDKSPQACQSVRR